MGEQDRALHEIADARARLSELADELARKAEPERLKAMAHDKAEELKVKAKEFAVHKKDELKQHAKDAAVEKATELKTRTKETVMQKSMELKERADTPKGWSLLGALLGAGVGSALMRKAFTKREERWSDDRYDTRYGRYRDDRWNEDDRWRYDGLRSSGRADVGVGYADRGYSAAERTDIGYNSGSSYGGVSYDEVSSRNMGATDVDTGDTGGGMKARATDAAHNVRDRAVDVKDRAMGKATEVRERAAGAVDNLRERASHLRERIPERQVMQQRTTDWFNRTLEEQPLLLALGGIALGMVASTLMPVSNKERQLIQPAKRRAEESISQLGEQLNQKLGVNEQSSTSSTEFRQDFSSASDMSATSDLSTPASTGFGATSVGPGVTGTSYGATSATPTGAPVVDSSADTMASSPTGSSRIPPLPNLDDLTGKVH
jgi:hypothetical protein